MKKLGHQVWHHEFAECLISTCARICMGPEESELQNLWWIQNFDSQAVMHSYCYSVYKFTQFQVHLARVSWKDAPMRMKGLKAWNFGMWTEG